jgi:membrane-bound lytic murein transglycosylase B
VRAALVICVAALAGCGGGGGTGETPRPAAVASPGGPPPAAAPLPRTPATLAARLQSSSDGLRAAIGAWADRDAAEPPEDVTLWALDQQRALRLLAARPRLAAAVLARVRPATRRFAREVLAAMDDLRRLSPPPRRRRFRVGPALAADRLLGHYRSAQRRFHVGWHILAAVNFVESAFGKLRNDSVAGAQGPMQFLPATWRAYGLGGDIQDPHDAILGAANYLHANGAPGSYARALYRYNPSPLYVDAVLRYARLIAARRPVFYGFYAWQVFVRTPEGTRRLTGPP